MLLLIFFQSWMFVCHYRTIKMSPIHGMTVVLEAQRLLSSTWWTTLFDAWISPNLSHYIGPHPRVSDIVRRWARGVKSISDIYQLRKFNFADYSQSRQRKQCTRVNDDTPKDTTTMFWSSPEYLNELNVQCQKSAWRAINSQSVM